MDSDFWQIQKWVTKLIRFSGTYNCREIFGSQRGSHPGRASLKSLASRQRSVHFKDWEGTVSRTFLRTTLQTDDIDELTAFLHPFWGTAKLHCHSKGVRDRKFNQCAKKENKGTHWPKLIFGVPTGL